MAAARPPRPATGPPRRAAAAAPPADGGPGAPDPAVGDGFPPARRLRPPQRAVQESGQGGHVRPQSRPLGKTLKWKSAMEPLQGLAPAVVTAPDTAAPGPGTGHRPALGTLRTAPCQFFRVGFKHGSCAPAQPALTWADSRGKILWRELRQASRTASRTGDDLVEVTSGSAGMESPGQPELGFRLRPDCGMGCGSTSISCIRLA